jgi:hypothetical protein
MIRSRFVLKKPEGQLTRGKTASNRLRRVDNFILLYEPSLLSRTDGLFADSLLLTSAKAYGLRPWFETAAQNLTQYGYSINLQKRFLNRGWLIWYLKK